MSAPMVVSVTLDDRIHLGRILNLPHCRHQLIFPNCWACSTTDAVLALYRREGWSVPVRFSPQDLVNNMRAYGTQIPEPLRPQDYGSYPAFHSTVANFINRFGLVSAYDVPYVGAMQEPPNPRPVEGIFANVQFVQIQHHNSHRVYDQQLIDVLTLRRQPVVVAVASAPEHLNINTIHHGAGQHGHSVLLVGHGNTVYHLDNGESLRGEPYWIIRDSRGPSFCDGGYYRCAMNPYVLSDAWYPIPTP